MPIQRASSPVQMFCAAITMPAVTSPCIGAHAGDAAAASRTRPVTVDAFAHVDAALRAARATQRA